MGDPLKRQPRPWHRLSFRIAVFVGACVIVADLLSDPLYVWVDNRLYPADGSPELSPLSEWLTYMGLTLAYATALGLLLGWAASRFFMSRLRAIATQASQPGSDQLPDPFDETGRDEVAQLARALNDMRAQILELLSRLAERDQKRDEWIVQVSHDLRTPLTALITGLEHCSVRIERGGEIDAELREINEAAMIDAQRVATLAEDLLEIARLEVEDVIQFESILAEEIIDHTVRGLEPLARDAGVTLVSDISDDLPTIEAEGRLLVRALENLTLNSIQHAHSWVRVAATHRGSQLRFTVQDDGDGFPSRKGVISFDELKKLRSRTDSAGLGLMVVQRVALAHGGDIEARNRNDGGAEVELRLPVGRRTA
jgi:signal transduction histidine kinase